MSQNTGFWNRFFRAVADFFSPPEEMGVKTTPQQLQEALGREIELANAKQESAKTAMVSAALMRQELAELVAKHDALRKLALKKEQAGDSEGAKKILALQMALEEQIAPKTKAYQETDKRAANLIDAARKQQATVESAKAKLPQAVLQIEVNRMREEAQALENQAAASLDGSTSFDNLVKGIEMKTAVLDAGHLLTGDSGESLEDEIQKELAGAEFERAYRQLQLKAQEQPGDVVEAELVEGGSPADEARRLLSGPAFDGKLKIS